MKITHGELFAGISGFGVGFEPAGIETRWRVEIDDAPRSVLAYRYPEAPLLRDVRECGAHNLERVDVITFGSPCQDLSVAGRRAGLDGTRSGLFYEAIRIVRELQPDFAIWENVPGAFSSNAGRDFAAVLCAFRECGARDVAWRTCDAQYDGVAQRRQRVFVVADFRGERAGEILFERACLCGHPAPGRQAGAGVARTITASPGGCSGKEQQYTFIGSAGHPLNDLDGVAPCLQEREGKGQDSNCTRALIADALGSGSPVTAPLLANYGEKWGLGDQEAFSGHHHVIAHALTAEGHDASEDGTGRGVPLVAATLTRGGGPSGTAGRRKEDDHNLVFAIGFHGRQNPIHLDECSLPLEAQKGQCVAAGFKRGQGSKARSDGFQLEQSPTLTSSDSGTQQSPGVLIQRGADLGVRRLTPLECERLQGFSDDWTRWGVNADGLVVELKDSPRYRMLGNAVATVTARWIGRRLAAVMRGEPLE